MTQYEGIFAARIITQYEPAISICLSHFFLFDSLKLFVCFKIKIRPVKIVQNKFRTLTRFAEIIRQLSLHTYIIRMINDECNLYYVRLKFECMHKGSVMCADEIASRSSHHLACYSRSAPALLAFLFTNERGGNNCFRRIVQRRSFLVSKVFFERM